MRILRYRNAIIVGNVGYIPCAIFISNFYKTMSSVDKLLGRMFHNFAI